MDKQCPVEVWSGRGQRCFFKFEDDDFPPKEFRLIAKCPDVMYAMMVVTALILTENSVTLDDPDSNTLVKNRITNFDELSARMKAYEIGRMLGMSLAKSKEETVH